MREPVIHLRSVGAAPTLPLASAIAAADAIPRFELGKHTYFPRPRRRPHRADRLYAITYEGEVIASPDGGDEWHTFGTP